MVKQFSIQKAATRTAINSKPSILAKIFKKLIITQFKKINYGCIILNENNSKVIFGDEGSKLKTEVNIYSDEF